MTWTSPDIAAKRARAIKRAVVLWGLLGLMTLLALFIQLGYVPAGAATRLTQEVTTGPLTVWLPEGWLVEQEPATGDLVAVEQTDSRAAGVLQIRFRQADEPITPRDLLQDRGREEEFLGRVPMGDGEGRMFAAVRPAALSLFAGEGEMNGYIFTVSAVRVVEGGLTIRLERPIADPGDWDEADILLVRRIAGRLELDKTAL